VVPSTTRASELQTCLTEGTKFECTFSVAADLNHMIQVNANSIRAGDSSVAVDVPSGLPDGTRTLRAEGIDGYLNPRHLTVQVTLVSAVAAVPDVAPADPTPTDTASTGSTGSTGSAEGSVVVGTVNAAAAAGTAGVPTPGSADLADTGFSALPYAGGGAVALFAGAGLIVASRRRAG
jgi:hypothetical protein